MRKVVMLSLDALFDADLERLEENSTLKEWLSHAAACTQVKTVFPALTYPAHATLITGCDPARHGIGQNQPFQPRKGSAERAWYWDAKNVKRETLFDAVKKAGGKSASVLWPVTGKHPSITWNFPEVLALPGENQVLKMLEYGTAPWILRMEIKHGRKRKSIHEPHLSDYATLLVKDVIRARQPDLTCAHLVDLDEMRHLHGTFSGEAAEAIRRHGERVDEIWRLMRQTKGMENALLVLVSDHGQADVTRTVCLADAFAKAGCFVQVQSNGMSAYLFGSREALEKARTYIAENREETGVARVYGRQELDAMGCVSEPALAVEAAEGVVFEDALDGRKREKATHGFGPGHSAENCLFAVRGEGIKEGMRLESMPMRDVAPTVAGLMGMKLEECEGTDHSGEIRSDE